MDCGGQIAKLEVRAEIRRVVAEIGRVVEQEARRSGELFFEEPMTEISIQFSSRPPDRSLRRAPPAAHTQRALRAPAATVRPAALQDPEARHRTGATASNGS